MDGFTNMPPEDDPSLWAALSDLFSSFVGVITALLRTIAAGISRLKRRRPNREAFRGFYAVRPPAAAPFYAFGPEEPPMPRLDVEGSTKYYAVARGRRTGIFNTPEEAQAQTQGVKYNLARSFRDRADAEAWLDRELGAEREGPHLD